MQLDMFPEVPKQQVNDQLKQLLDKSSTGIYFLDKEASQALLHGFILGYGTGDDFCTPLFAEVNRGFELGRNYRGKIIEGLEELDKKLNQAARFCESFNERFERTAGLWSPRVAIDYIIMGEK